MTDKTFTQADIDAAISEAKEALDKKNRELLAELKEARHPFECREERWKAKMESGEARVVSGLEPHERSVRGETPPRYQPARRAVRR